MASRIGIAMALVLALAGMAYLLFQHGDQRKKASIGVAVRVGCIALGMGAWLALASTALLWIFPFSILLSIAVGYIGTKRALHAFPRAEVQASALLSLALGLGVAVAIAASGDSFLTHVAAPYSLLNAIALAVSSYLALRFADREAAGPGVEP